MGLSLCDPEVPLLGRHPPGDLDLLARIDEVRALSANQSGLSALQIADVDAALLIDSDRLDEGLGVVVAEVGLAVEGIEDLDLVEREEERVDPGEDHLIAWIVDLLRQLSPTRQPGGQLFPRDLSDEPQPEPALGQQLVGVVDSVAGALGEEGVIGAREDPGWTDLDLALAVCIEDDAELLLPEHHGLPDEPVLANLSLQRAAVDGAAEQGLDGLRGQRGVAAPLKTRRCGRSLRELLLDGLSPSGALVGLAAPAALGVLRRLGLKHLSGLLRHDEFVIGDVLFAR